MVKKIVAAPKKSQSGFTFIEMLLVIVVIGIIIAVIVPRAWRANIEAKYGLVQQAATELGSWGMTWGERILESQPESYSCILDDYIATLVNYTGDQDTNWVDDITTDSPGGCASGDSPTYTVADIMSQDKPPRNPFNGVSYFNAVNNGGSLQTGLLYLAFACDGGYKNYYFVYTGTDSTSPNDWHAGMGSAGNPIPLANLRNGIFVARLLKPGACE